MKLSEIKQILSEREWKLTKSLGQNFLHDQNQLRRIVAAAELGPADKVLEIGPGLGPLTELLAARAGEVLAIEKDRRLFDFLREKFSGAPHVKLLHDDALRYVKRNQRLGGLEIGRQFALFGCLAHSGRVGGERTSARTDGGHAATGSGAPD